MYVQGMHSARKVPEARHARRRALVHDASAGVRVEERSAAPALEKKIGRKIDPSLNRMVRKFPVEQNYSNGRRIRRGVLKGKGATGGAVEAG